MRTLFSSILALAWDCPIWKFLQTWCMWNDNFFLICLILIYIKWCKWWVNGFYYFGHLLSVYKLKNCFKKNETLTYSIYVVKDLDSSHPTFFYNAAMKVIRIRIKYCCLPIMVFLFWDIESQRSVLKSWAFSFMMWIFCSKILHIVR